MLETTEMLVIKLGPYLNLVVYHGKLAEARCSAKIRLFHCIVVKRKNVSLISFDEIEHFFR
jgi:hypothetical protein